MEPLLQMNEVTASFRTRDGVVRAVDRVSLELRHGRVFGLIGETGSGKSVLGMSIPGLLPDTAEVSGSILFKGDDLLQLDRESLRKRRGSEIAFIPQNPATSLNPVLTIGYQLREAIARHGNRLSRRQLDERAVQLLRSMGMPEPERKLSSYPFQLSGGMKQRVLAAIGLSGSPSLIIADEPTKGLDAVVRNQVVDMLSGASRLTGASMLVITHDLLVAKALCDEIGVMYAGQIVEQGSAADLFCEPKHPYTQGLLGSMPGRGMRPIPGSYSGWSEPDIGCKFYARCEARLPACKLIEPQLTSVVRDEADRGLITSKARCLNVDSSRQSEQNVPRRQDERAKAASGSGRVV